MWQGHKDVTTPKAVKPLLHFLDNLASQKINTCSMNTCLDYWMR